MATTEELLAAAQNELALINSGITSQIAAISEAGTTAIEALDNYYGSILTKLTLSVFIDQTNGLDTNDGLTTAFPMKTIQAAINKTPAGGRCNVFMMDDYDVISDIVIRDRNVTCYSSDNSRRTMTFTRWNEVVNSNDRAYLYNFRLAGRAHVSFKNFRFDVPDSDGAWASRVYSDRSALFTYLTLEEATMLSLGLVNVEINRPATSKFPMSGIPGPMSIHTNLVTAVGGSLNGAWLFDTTNVAGTDPATKSRLLTNLATI